MHAILLQYFCMLLQNSKEQQVCTIVLTQGVVHTGGHRAAVQTVRPTNRGKEQRGLIQCIHLPEMERVVY